MGEQDHDTEVDELKRTMLKALAGGSAGGFVMDGVAAKPPKKDRSGGDLPGKGRGRGGRGRGFYPERAVPKQDGTPIPLELYATQYALHPHQDRAIFTTAIYGEDLRLYVADGIAESTDAPTTVHRVTDEPDLVAALEWRQGNRIRYDKGFVRYERKLPPSNAVFAPDVVEDPSFQGVESL